MSSVITVHSVDPSGKHVITAFQDVSIVHESSPSDRHWLDGRGSWTPVQATYEIHGSDGYVVAEASTTEGAYLELLQSQAEKIAELEHTQRLLASESNRLYYDLEQLKNQIRIAIGDKEPEPDEEEVEEW